MPVNRDEAPKIIEVHPEPSSGPQVPSRGWCNEALGAVVMLIGVSFLLVGTALTVGRFGLLGVLPLVAAGVNLRQGVNTTSR